MGDRSPAPLVPPDEAPPRRGRQALVWTGVAAAVVAGAVALGPLAWLALGSSLALGGLGVLHARGLRRAQAARILLSDAQQPHPPLDEATQRELDAMRLSLARGRKQPLPGGDLALTDGGGELSESEDEPSD